MVTDADLFRGVGCLEACSVQIGRSKHFFENGSGFHLHLSRMENELFGMIHTQRDQIRHELLMANRHYDGITEYSAQMSIIFSILLFHNNNFHLDKSIMLVV